MFYPALDLRLPAGYPDLQLHWDLAATILADHQLLGIEERDGTHWRVCFASPEAREAAQRALTSAAALQALTLAQAEVPDEDWASRTQAELQAVRVGSLVIAPPWDLPESPIPNLQSRPMVIVVTPSMAFGTGHHASTRLCLELLQRLDLTGRTVLDVGTGSGVLAIAAARLGARHVTAIDADPDAIACAQDNVRLNDVAEAVELVVGDVPGIRGPKASVVLANLTGAFFQRHGHALLARAERGGYLVLSGFRVDEETAVSATFGDGAVLETRAIEMDWVGQLWKVL